MDLRVLLTGIKRITVAKFKDLDVKLGQSNYFEHKEYAVYKIKLQKLCKVCQSTTSFVQDIGILLPLCSEECQDKWWEDYNRA